jgi:transposase
MGYIEGNDRSQLTFLPECIDDYVDENNPVRVIDIFVDSLDMDDLGFLRTQPADTGRPPYNPKDLLKLYIYGYMNRIRSSRRLEKESSRNIELIWLINKLSPDFKTIADFRKDNKDAIKKVFKYFVLLCKDWGLYGNELITVDSSKFKAWNSKKKNFNKDKLNKKIKEIELKIEEYMDELDENDKHEPAENQVRAGEIKKRLEELKNRKIEYEKYRKELENSEETQISLTDPDSRSMVNNQKIEVCYNVQTTVEEKNKLLLDYEVTNQVKDQGQLSIMGKRAKGILGADNIDVLADKGYHVSIDIKECVDSGITPYVPKPKNPNAYDDEEFHTENFKYNKEMDVYICPGGEELALKHTYTKRGMLFKRYYNYDACSSCKLRSKCTQAKVGGRNVDRWEYQDIIDKIEIQTKENWDKYRKRQWLAEHPFGTIKRGFT